MCGGGYTLRWMPLSCCHNHTQRSPAIDLSNLSVTLPTRSVHSVGSWTRPRSAYGHSEHSAVDIRCPVRCDGGLPSVYILSFSRKLA